MIEEKPRKSYIINLDIFLPLMMLFLQLFVFKTFTYLIPFTLCFESQQNQTE